jgi:hypothetical protein
LGEQKRGTGLREETILLQKRITPISLSTVISVSRVLNSERLERSITALENLEKVPTVRELMDTLTT